MAILLGLPESFEHFSLFYWSARNSEAKEMLRSHIGVKRMIILDCLQLCRSDRPPSTAASQRAHFLSSRFNLLAFYPNNVPFNIIDFPNCKIFRLPVHDSGLGPVTCNVLCILFGLVFYGNQRIIIYTRINKSILPVFVLSKLFNIKLVIDHWDHPLMEYEYVRDSGRYFSAIFRLFLARLGMKLTKNADLIIATPTRDTIKGVDILPSRIHVVPRAVNFKKIKEIIATPSPRSSDSFVLVFFGTCELRHGLRLLLSLAELLHNEIHGLTLKLLGPMDDDSSKYYRNWSSKNQAASSVEATLKAISWESGIRQCAASDVCLLPLANHLSTEIAVPVKLLEYLTIGKVIIASNTMGLRTLIKSGVNGFLLGSESAASWADVIKQIHANPKLRKTIEINALNTVSENEHSWESAKSKYLAGFDTFLR